MVTARIERILAPNPSPMTLEGTNSYLLVAGPRALAIDPGPPDAAHVERIAARAASFGATIEAIAVTHGHPDHAPGAALLQAHTGAPVFGHTEATFPVDRRVAEGDRIVVGDVGLEVMAAPGHARDHLVFYLEPEAALFTGDVIVGRGTVVVAPPNGDMRAYQATLRRLRDEFGRARTIYGGHGNEVDAPAQKIVEYIAHRQAREAQLLAALAGEERTIPELVAHVYRDVATALWPAAARQVFAYLLALAAEGRVVARTLERTPTSAERAIMNPDLSRLVDAQSVAVATAELGFDREGTSLEVYARV